MLHVPNVCDVFRYTGWVLCDGPSLYWIRSDEEASQIVRWSSNKSPEQFDLFNFACAGVSQIALDPLSKTPYLFCLTSNSREVYELGDKGLLSVDRFAPEYRHSVSVFPLRFTPAFSQQADIVWSEGRDVFAKKLELGAEPVLLQSLDCLPYAVSPICRAPVYVAVSCSLVSGFRRESVLYLLGYAGEVLRRVQFETPEVGICQYSDMLEGIVLGQGPSRGVPDFFSMGEYLLDHDKKAKILGLLPLQPDGSSPWLTVGEIAGEGDFECSHVAWEPLSEALGLFDPRGLVLIVHNGWARLYRIRDAFFLSLISHRDKLRAVVCALNSDSGAMTDFQLEHPDGDWELINEVRLISSR